MHKLTRVLAILAMGLLAGAWTHGSNGGSNFLLDGTGGKLLDGAAGKLRAQ